MAQAKLNHSWMDLRTRVTVPLVSDVLKRTSCSAVRLLVFKTIDECLGVGGRKTSLLQEIRSDIEASERKIGLNLWLLVWLLCILFIFFLTFIWMHIYCFSNDFLSLKNMSRELKELSGKGKTGEGKKRVRGEPNPSGPLTSSFLCWGQSF